jgi:Carboxypeptidase regulatory-like domain
MSRKLSPRFAALSALAVLVALCAVAGTALQKKDKGAGRLLSGRVLDQHDNPINNAVVYLTNTRTRAVKTYIASQDGGYRFPALADAVDYEVYAQYNGRKSDTKSVSQFDDRPQVYIDLKISIQ